MSNEELVAVIQAGATEHMGELWEQVAGLVKWKTNQVMTALQGRGSVEFDDLYQSGYLAMVAAVGSYKPESGAFSTWFMFHLKTAFAEATGYRTQRGNEPLNHAFSLEAPLSDEANAGIFSDLIPDLRGTAMLEAVEDREYLQQLRKALEEALAAIPEQYADVLRLRHYQGLAFAYIGESKGVSAECVRQMELKGIRELRRPRYACHLRPFYDFDFYCGTGLGAFQHTGMSVQERYLIIEEEHKERAERRCQEQEEKQQKERFQSELERIRQEAQEKVAGMTPEEKQALLERYGYT